MKINLRETKAKIKAERGTITCWANLNGFRPKTVSMILNGRYSCPNGDVYKSIVDALQSDSLLVLSDAA